MKSILWILNGCGLESHGITGAPVRFHEISKRFRDKGLSQHMLTTFGGKEMVRALGCELPYTIAPASLFLKHEPCVPFRLWSYIVTAMTWKTVFPKLPKSEVVITVSDYFCDIIPALTIKRKIGAKWIAWIHHCESDPRVRPGNRVANELTYRMQRWSFRRIAEFADEAWINDTVAGDEIESRLLTMGMDKGKIRRMRNGIDLEAIRIAETPEVSSDAVMIGVRANKGMHDIIPIWQRVQKLRPSTRLVLMGGMSGEGDVVREIERLGLPIEVRHSKGGFLPAKEYYSQMKSAKILFAPSHEEGWGIAVCEAMAAGLPVVAYDLPAYQRIYKGAYVPVKCFDFDAFASSLVKVLDSPELYDGLRLAGMDTASKYAWDMVADDDLSKLLGG